MSSLVRSFASLYCQKLRSATRLGPVTAAPPRFQALNRRGLSASSGAAEARRPPALPMPSQQSQSQQQKRTPFFTWARLAVGSILAAATPFLHSRWASFLRIQRIYYRVLTARYSRPFITDAKFNWLEAGCTQVDEIEEHVKGIMNHSKHMLRHD
ncbi:unnamed protein product [Miscanthus lutarioriparius]|uniref:Uncharacterized protein n=1 Tax=Miscanthus lutarioriparius TaxID=422564 RepID=A0A811MHE1_9POAL|nr:unnamed protein product [Miscanthus lutarioriparius]